MSDIEVKERIGRAVDCMDDTTATKLWDVIVKDFGEFAEWALIPEEEPDDFDLYMLSRIKKDSDCHEFVSSDELKRELGLKYEDRIA